MALIYVLSNCYKHIIIANLEDAQGLQLLLP